MKAFYHPALAMLGTAFLLASTASAQSTDRLTDKDVKTLLEDVDNGRDRFEDQLDGKLKGSIVRGPNGEVNVGKFLDDLQENTGNLKDRFTEKYSASAEAATVLRQGSTIQRFMKEQAPGFKGASEWDHLARTLTRLAAAYGTTFPTDQNAPVRRINDAEAAAAAEAVASHADQFKNAVNREKALAKPAKDALKSEADLVKNGAKTLKSRLNESKPSTAEARDLFGALRKLDETAKGSGLSPATLTAMGGLRAPLATLNQAFGVLPAPGTN
jgi:hypothetical protein